MRAIHLRNCPRVGLQESCTRRQMGNLRPPTETGEGPDWIGAVLQEMVTTPGNGRIEGCSGVRMRFRSRNRDRSLLFSERPVRSLRQRRGQSGPRRYGNPSVDLDARIYCGQRHSPWSCTHALGSRRLMHWSGLMLISSSFTGTTGCAASARAGSRGGVRTTGAGRDAGVCGCVTGTSCPPHRFRPRTLGLRRLRPRKLKAGTFHSRKQSRARNYSAAHDRH